MRTLSQQISETAGETPRANLATDNSATYSAKFSNYLYARVRGRVRVGTILARLSPNAIILISSKAAGRSSTCHLQDCARGFEYLTYSIK